MVILTVRSFESPPLKTHQRVGLLAVFACFYLTRVQLWGRAERTPYLVRDVYQLRDQEYFFFLACIMWADIPSWLVVQKEKRSRGDCKWSKL